MPSIKISDIQIRECMRQGWSNNRIHTELGVGMSRIKRIRDFYVGAIQPTQPTQPTHRCEICEAPVKDPIVVKVGGLKHYFDSDACASEYELGLKKSTQPTQSTSWDKVNDLYGTISDLQEENDALRIQNETLVEKMATLDQGAQVTRLDLVDLLKRGSMSYAVRKQIMRLIER